MGFALLQVNADAAELGSQALGVIQGNWTWLLLGVLLIVAAVVVFMFLKKIIVNSVLGLVAWALLYFVIGVKMEFMTSLIVAAIFGLAGIGVLLVLKFLGVPV